MNYTVIQGNNIDVLKQYEDNTIDSIVTDPPYGIEFLGKDWDSNTGAVETWRECLRVLKPGGYLLAFSAARTYHHLATNIESVGFDIRDQLMWLYSSGFPKAQDVGKAIQRRQGVEKTKPSKGMNAYPEESYKNFNRGVNPGNLSKKDYPDKKAEVIPTSPEALQWSGWKTALKPAHEPIVMARKPMKGSTIDNVLEHGTGALNVDATRIETDEKIQTGAKQPTSITFERFSPEDRATKDSNRQAQDPNKDKWKQNDKGRFPSNVIGEVKDYEKYFYSPKVSRAERHTGFEIEDIPTTEGGMYDNHGTGKMYNVGSGTKKKEYNQTGTLKRMKDKMHKSQVVTETDMLKHMDGYFCDENGNKKEEKGSSGKVIKLPHLPGTIQIHSLKKHYEDWCKAQGITANVGNNHPTVKPVELMKYLIKLVTPPNGTVLDPFTGSGSTGMAAVELGYEFIGIELDPHYVDIANKRITAWNKPLNNFKDLFEEKEQ